MAVSLIMHHIFYYHCKEEKISQFTNAGLHNANGVVCHSSSNCLHVLKPQFVVELVTQSTVGTVFAITKISWLAGQKSEFKVKAQSDPRKWSINFLSLFICLGFGRRPGVCTSEHVYLTRVHIFPGKFSSHPPTPKKETLCLFEPTCTVWWCSSPACRTSKQNRSIWLLTMSFLFFAQPLKGVPYRNPKSLGLAWTKYSCLFMANRDKHFGEKPLNRNLACWNCPSPLLLLCNAILMKPHDRGHFLSIFREW